MAEDEAAGVAIGVEVQVPVHQPHRGIGEPNIQISPLEMSLNSAHYISGGGNLHIFVVNLQVAHGKTSSLQSSQEEIEKLTSPAKKLPK